VKRRHLLVGFTVVLAISLAVPALGAGSLAGVKTLARKAYAAATGAQSTASNAQQVAGNAVDAAKTAQGVATNAANKASAAETAANAAQTTVGTAQATASAAQNAAGAAQAAAVGAQGTATNAQNTATTAKATADAAATAAGGKFGHIESTEPAASVTKQNNIKEAIVSCPAGTTVVAGGYHFTSGTAEVHVDEATGNNGWRVQAQSGGDPFDFVVTAMCLKP